MPPPAGRPPCRTAGDAGATPRSDPCPVEPSSTADAACVIRLWMERDDPVLRGRVEAGGAARGVDDLLVLVRRRLEDIERSLTRELLR